MIGFESGMIFISFQYHLPYKKKFMKNVNLFRNLLVITGLLFLVAACSPSDPTIAESAKSKVSTMTGVNVDVKDGVLTLSGEVADDATKAAAETAVKDVKGVKSVVNNLTVPPPPPPPTPVVINPDDVLRSGLESAFASKGIQGITATVSNGEVTLTGNVKKADLTKVMQAANELKPKKVNNKMTIIK
jgi:hyperosmotically inducible periplasmic protein